MLAGRPGGELDATERAIGATRRNYLLGRSLCHRKNGRWGKNGRVWRGLESWLV